jgi:hypothetical protein
MDEHGLLRPYGDLRQRAFQQRDAFARPIVQFHLRHAGNLHLPLQHPHVHDGNGHGRRRHHVVIIQQLDQFHHQYLSNFNLDFTVHYFVCVDNLFDNIGGFYVRYIRDSNDGLNFGHFSNLYDPLGLHKSGGASLHFDHDDSGYGCHLNLLVREWNPRVPNSGSICCGNHFGRVDLVSAPAQQAEFP